MSLPHPKHLRISDFTYDLPDARIPRYPAEKRDSSKLLIYDKGTISETVFKELPLILPEEAFLVFNESKVIPARLIFKNLKGQQIEVFCLEPQSGNYHLTLSAQGSCTWRCLTGGLKRWKPEDRLSLKINGISLEAELLVREPTAQLIKFTWQPLELSFSEIIERSGVLPIPPYLTRKTEEIDKDRYQTVYSKTEGSVAAPTAGLHFTPDLLAQLKKQGIVSASLILHVGAGTFKPVKAETLADHEMHAEWMVVERSFVEHLINNLGRPVIPVGTTSLRALESLYWLGIKTMHQPNVLPANIAVCQWDPYEMESSTGANESLTALLSWLTNNGLQSVQIQTQILIAPPYRLKIATALITNFHQPNSTLLVLVSAVIGKKWKDVYEYALSNGFRFLSYGDSSLLIPAGD